MPLSDNLPPFLRRRAAPAPTASTPGADAPDFLADAITDTVVEHLPDAVQQRVRDTVRRPLARRIARALLVTLLTLYFLFGATVLLLRYVVMPEIGSYRPQVERLLSKSLARQVTIDAIDAYWVGLQPALRLSGIAVLDERRQPALQLDRVDARLGWDSVAFLQLRLAQLDIIAPALQLRREADGRLFVAGLDVTGDGGADHSFGDWLLAQRRIVVRDATLEWTDAQRGAPTLRLQHVDFRLDNSWRRHRFGLAATPPEALATRLDLRGDLYGRDLATLNAWHGELFAEVARADLAAWQPWFDYPLELTAGHGGARLWMEFARGAVNAVTADLQLADARLRLGNALPALDLVQLSGRVAGKRTGGDISINLDRVSLQTRDGIVLPATNARFARTVTTAAERIDIGADAIDLDILTRLAGFLPLDADLASQLAQRQARGRISDLRAGWSRRGDGPPTVWQVNARFSNLGMAADEEVPGVSGLSGRVVGDQNSGRLNLDAQQAGIHLPMVFAGGPMVFDTLDAHLEWAHSSGGTALNLRRARFANADVAGEASGSWLPRDGSPGVIDLTARLERAKAVAVSRYFPSSLPDTQSWLAHALRAGEASNARLILRGDLAQFPFRKAGSGQFEVRADVHDATLDYADGWPSISGIDGELLFVGASMRIEARQGQIVGTTIKKAVAKIDDLEVANPMLAIDGQVSGPTPAFLAFVEASPVGASIDHATRTLAAEGNGTLDLELRFPLADMNRSTVAGTLRLDDNRVLVDPALPWLTQVRGVLRFTDHDLTARGLTGRLWGMPIGADLRSNDGVFTATLRGDIQTDALRREVSAPFAAGLSGNARWAGVVKSTAAGTTVSINSDLVGLTSQLPEPLNKTASDVRRLSIERKPIAVAQPPNYSRGGTAPGNAALGTAAARPDFSLLDVRLAERARLMLVSDPTRSGAIVRGALTLGRDNAVLPEKNLLAQIDLPRLNIDEWRKLLPADGAGDDWPPLRFEANTLALTMLGKTFDNLHISGDTAGSTTRIDARSASFSASLAYDSRGKGRLTGNMPRLALSGPVDALETAGSDLKARDVITQLPAIALTIDQLSYKGRELGAVTLNADNRLDGNKAQWNAQVQLKNADATFDGRLAWLPDEPTAQSQLAFELDVRNIEKTLGRVGYPDAVKRGDARIDGTLTWNGPPTSVDYPTLTGGLLLTTGKGQFNKLEPGVGRLLGILSLQSLPRRITLDFRDVFSEGFAFDRIDGDLNVNAGVMRTDNLEVRGPAARIFMKGDVDLARETQHLTVRVQPSVSDTVAVGALLAANPVAGAIAWAAQKLLSDPLDQVFAFDYIVTGSWADPKVDKLGAEVTKKAAP